MANHYSLPSKITPGLKITRRRRNPCKDIHGSSSASRPWKIIAGDKVDVWKRISYVHRMNDTFDHHEFDKRLAVLEERMKTLNAENTSAQERLNATLERFHTVIADLKTENATRDKEAAQRDKDNQRWIVGIGIAQLVIIIAIIAAGFAFLGILIGLPVAA